MMIHTYVRCIAKCNSISTQVAVHVHKCSRGLYNVNNWTKCMQRDQWAEAISITNCLVKLMNWSLERTPRLLL